MNTTRFNFCFFFSLTFLTLKLAAQPASHILHQLQTLNTIGSVLYIAAHPDDENTRLLSYLANERHLKTTYLSITRGDGGQNLIGSEQGDLLGLIRTEELLAARKTDGASQWFTRAVDFGYSKNPEETFRFWNKDSVLADVVYAIRQCKPDVIICRFPTTGEGGHGHHTASAILAEEAFQLAADPKAFPEQLKTVEVWQAKRLFWNTFNFGRTNTTAEDQLKIDVGGFNPLLGKSYGEIAAESRSMHKSQGFGSAKQRGSQYEYFKLIKGDKAEQDLFDGFALNWTRLEGGAGIAKLLKACIQNFNALETEKNMEALIRVHAAIKKIKTKDAYTAWWIEAKLKELESIIAASAGIWAETTAEDYLIIPGFASTYTSRVLMRNPAGVKLKSIQFPASGDTLTDFSLLPNQMFEYKRSFPIDPKSGYSSPYWLEQPHETGLHTVSQLALRGRPQNPEPLQVVYHFQIGNFQFSIEQAVLYKSTDPVKGEIYRPIEILPPLSINPKESIAVLNGDETKSLFFVLKAHTANLKGQFRVKELAGSAVKVMQSDFHLLKKGDEVTIELRLASSLKSFDGEIEPYVVLDGQSYHQQIQRIEYDHIPYRFVLSASKVRILKFDLIRKGNRLGYIPGAGDNVAACLTQIGYQVDMLDDLALNSADLSVYDAIIAGIRAYNTNERLPLYHEKLMKYVENGGRYMVQYNTNSRVGPIQTAIGPYPFTISRNRVTDETASVQFIDPNHRLLHMPNKITQADFDYWIQERGIYFATALDSNYQTVFSMQDPGEEAENGSLIYAKYGKGYFVYTGLAFFRELPAGVAGAYRLFVNIISQETGKENHE